MKIYSRHAFSWKPPTLNPKVPEDTGGRFIIFSVQEVGSDGVISTSSGQLVTRPVIYRFDTETGKTWRLEKVKYEGKNGALVEFEGWSLISEKNPTEELIKFSESESGKKPKGPTP